MREKKKGVQSQKLCRRKDRDGSKGRIDIEKGENEGRERRRDKNGYTQKEREGWKNRQSEAEMYKRKTS